MISLELTQDELVVLILLLNAQAEDGEFGNGTVGLLLKTKLQGALKAATHPN